MGDYDGPPLSGAARETFERMRPEARILQPAGSTHFIPMERPDLIKEEIERMAATVRSEL
jgi:pimeloyl-ACP methyl ester carboxylesterase